MVRIIHAFYGFTTMFSVQIIRVLINFPVHFKQDRYIQALW